MSACAPSGYARCAAPPPAGRRCARCRCLLSRQADARDAYCIACHPGLERSPGAVLRAARSSSSDPAELTRAAHDLADRRWHRA